MQEPVLPKRHFFIFDLQQLTFFNKFGIYFDRRSCPSILEKTKAKCNHTFYLHTMKASFNLIIYFFTLLTWICQSRETSGGSLFKKRKVAIWLFFQSPNKKRGEVLSEEIAVNHFDEGSIRLYV